MAGRALLLPLRRRRFRRMVTAQFVSEIGDGITTVALPLYVLARTGSPLATSLTFMAELLVGVVFGVIGGVLADGFDRRVVLICSYLARAVLLALAVAAGPLWLAVSLGVLARAGGQLDNPSFDAMVPGHAEGDLQQVLALRRLVQAMSITVGPAIGAFAVTVVGPRPALLLDAATFLIAFCVLAPIRGLDATIGERRAAAGSIPLRERVGSMLAGMAIIAHTPGVRRLAVYWAGAMAAVALVMAAAVIWYDRTLDVADAWYGIAVSAYGIGATVGLAWAGGRRFRLALPVVLLLAAPVYAVSSAVGVAADVAWLLPAGWLVWGIAMGPEQVLGELAFVEAIPESNRGRAFAGLGIVTTLGMAAGYGAAGPLLEAFGARTTILVSSVLVLALGGFWVGPAVRSIGHAPAPAPAAELVHPA